MAVRRRYGLLPDRLDDLPEVGGDVPLGRLAIVASKLLDKLLLDLLQAHQVLPVLQDLVGLEPSADRNNVAFGLSGYLSGYLGLGYQSGRYRAARSAPGAVQNAQPLRPRAQRAALQSVMLCLQSPEGAPVHPLRLAAFAVQNAGFPP